MADESRNPLELDVVVRRFTESADALSNVREQLQILTRLGEAEERTNASLRQTAQEVARFAAEAAKALKGLEEAQTRASEVLKTGADLLDGTALKGIEESVKANAQSIARMEKRVESLDSELVSGVRTLQEITESVKGNAQGISRANSRIDTIESRVSELTAMMEVIQADIKRVHADVKEPIIVKRFF